jgi:hypothetical protein
MRALILSDIHANLPVLEAVLAAAPHYDAVWNLGDIVGYGANPNEVVDLVRQLGGIVIRGNHDRACSGVMKFSEFRDFNSIASFAAAWTQEALSDENKKWLSSLSRDVRVVFRHLDFQPLGSSFQFLDFANLAVEGNRCVPANGESLAPAILAPLKIVGASWVFFLMAVHYNPVSFDPPAAVHYNGAVTVPELSYDSFGDIHFHGHLLAKAVPP